MALKVCKVHVHVCVYAISKHLLCGYFGALHDALHLHSHILSPHMPVQLGIDHKKLIGIDNRHSFTVY